MSVSDYVDRAGGYARYADVSLMFVVLPDGTSRKVERSWFAIGGANRLPPGTVIVVPKEIDPFSIRQTAIDLSQVLGQMAITAASLSILAK
jgi:polysaccharide biosynthesis/export protein